MSTGKNRRRYTREFKEEAVKLVVENGKRVSDVARMFDVHRSLLDRWIAQYHQDHEEAFPGNGNRKPSDEELRRLRQENAELKMERDILKKALAIFSKNPK